MDDPLDHVSDLEKDPTAISADLDADGAADVVMGDENRDGQADWVLRRESDGTSVATVDADDSGSLETAYADTDADGRFDKVTRDLDDDSDIDVTQFDSDADGVFETTVLADETVITLDADTGLVTDVSRDSVATDRVFATDPDRVNTSPPTTTTATAPTTPTDPDRVNTSAPPTASAPPSTTSPTSPATPIAQPSTGSPPGEPVTAPPPISTQPASQPAPPTTTSTSAPGTAPVIATPRPGDPPSPPAPLADEPAEQPAPPTSSSSEVDPGPPPPSDGTEASTQTPFPDQPGIGTDPAPPPGPIADETATQPAPPTSSSSDEDPGPPPPSDGTDASTQTPFPDQPGIGTDPASPPAPLADESATQPAPPTSSSSDVDPGLPPPADGTDVTTQTPFPDQPGIGDPEPVIDLVHGDADAERQFGQIQTENGYCGPVSIAMVLSELTGVQYGETQMVQAALDRNMLVGQPGDWDGMYVQDVAALLTEYGAPSHVEYGTTDSLRAYLDQGRDIILFVDSSEVWYGTDDDGTAGDRQDHFLVITEIDDSRGVATLNDPGWPSGVGREVSLAVIEDAWQDSSYQMVVTDGGVVYGRSVESTDLGAGQATRPSGSQAGDEHHAGFVILPVVLSALALLPLRGDEAASSTSRNK